MEILKRALENRKRSYCPYSRYAVGACVELGDGSLYDGCNIENASYGLTVCAERVAVFNAVSEKKNIKIHRIAIAGGKTGEKPDSYAFPCGACRQVINEFGDENTEIYVVKSEEEFKKYTLKELLPEAFGPNNL